MKIDEILEKFLGSPEEVRAMNREAMVAGLSLHDLAFAQIGIVSALTSLASAISELPDQSPESVRCVREAVATIRLVSDIITVGLADGLKAGKGE